MMKRILTLIALSLLLYSTASAFQGGGGESTTKKQSKRDKAPNSKPSTIKAPTGKGRSVDPSSLPIRLVRSIKIPRLAGFGNMAAVSHDGKLLAVEVGFTNGKPDGAIQLYDLQTGLPTHLLTGHTRQVTSIAFSPDSSMVVSGSHEFIRVNELKGEARIWDTRTGQLLQVFRGSTEPLIVKFSPDGHLVVAGNEWGPSEVRLWDVNSSQLLTTLSGHGDSGSNVDFSPDGRFMAVGSGETLDIWEFQSRQLVRTLKTNSNEMFALFSPDSKLFATIQQWTWLIRVWNLQTGELLGTINAIFHFPGEGVDPGCFCGLISISPDGQRISGMNMNNNVRIWNIRTGKLEREIKFPAVKNFTGVGRLLSDGKTSVDWDLNGIVRWWDISKIIQGASLGH